MAEKQEGQQVELILALFNAKKDFPKIFKTESNPFFKSKYADLAAIEEAIAAPLAANGLMILQPISTTVIDGRDFLRITTEIWHAPTGQVKRTISDFPFMSTQNRRDKKTGQAYDDPITLYSVASMITYLRRYLKMGALDLVTDDDDGAAAVAHQQQQYQPQPQQLATQKDVRSLMSEIEELGFVIDAKNYLAKINESSERMTQRTYELLAGRVRVQLNAKDG